MTYFQFRDPDFGKIKAPKKSFFLNLLYAIFPKANPDFDDKIEFIYEWLIEYDDNENCINREIGLEENGNTLIKMPHRNNYGFWVDSNLAIEDFHERFNVVYIDSYLFDKKWNELK